MTESFSSNQVCFQFFRAASFPPVYMLGACRHSESQLVISVVCVNTDNRFAVLIKQQGILHPLVVSRVFCQIDNQQSCLIHPFLLSVQFPDIIRFFHIVPDPHAAQIQVFKQRKHSIAVLFRETEIKIWFVPFIRRASALNLFHPSVGPSGLK
jgi:hypothetical protein